MNVTTAEKAVAAAAAVVVVTADGPVPAGRRRLYGLRRRRGGVHAGG